MKKSHALWRFEDPLWCSHDPANGLYTESAEFRHTLTPHLCKRFRLFTGLKSIFISQRPLNKIFWEILFRLWVLYVLQISFSVIRSCRQYYLERLTRETPYYGVVFTTTLFPDFWVQMYSSTPFPQTYSMYLLFYTKRPKLYTHMKRKMSLYEPG